ncbi:MAG TPA: indolepyruvate oxidoreductase subunit beta [Bacillota bacterium]|nr:indolepyruvate oxidoreductase subunit beta [Bacillota bacterium]
MRDLSFMLAGVGGQGIILAGDVLAEVGLQAGWDVKKSEVHGMAQRGGGVTSQVRWGRRVYSPLAEPGRIDILIGFEVLEALRNVHYLQSGGQAVVNRYHLPPPSVTGGEAAYPADADVEREFAARGATLRWMCPPPGTERLAVGVQLLGLVSAIEPLRGTFPAEAWLNALDRLVPPAHRELNRRAFQRGRAAAANGPPGRGEG